MAVARSGAAPKVARRDLFPVDLSPINPWSDTMRLMMSPTGNTLTTLLALTSLALAGPGCDAGADDDPSTNTSALSPGDQPDLPDDGADDQGEEGDAPVTIDLCGAQLDACLSEEGGDPEDCFAQLEECFGEPGEPGWPSEPQPVEPCEGEFFACLESGAPPEDCEAILADCGPDFPTPPPFPGEECEQLLIDCFEGQGDPEECDAIFFECLEGGHPEPPPFPGQECEQLVEACFESNPEDPQSCEDIFIECLEGGHPEPPPFPGQECEQLVEECFESNPEDPEFCEYIFIECLEGGHPEPPPFPGGECHQLVEECFMYGGDPQECEALLWECEQGHGGGGDHCEAIVDDCFEAGEDPWTCEAAYLVCNGENPWDDGDHGDCPQDECEELFEQCLMWAAPSGDDHWGGAGNIEECEQLFLECSGDSTDPDGPPPVNACEEEFVACFEAGNDPESCEQALMACFGDDMDYGFDYSDAGE